MILLKMHDRHGLALVFFDLLGNRYGQRLHGLLTANGRHCVARFHALVFARQTLQRHTDLRFPTTLGVRWRSFHLWQRLRHRYHLFAQHFTVTPGDEAVDERERIDRPSRIFFDVGLIGTKHPVTGLVHLDDDRTCWACCCLERTQRGSQGSYCWKVCTFERYEIRHYFTPIGF